MIEASCCSEDCRKSSLVSISARGNLNVPTTLYSGFEPIRLPNAARLTACIDNAQVCGSSYDCHFVNVRGEASSVQNATAKLVSPEDVLVTEARLAKTLLSAVLTTSTVNIHKIIERGDVWFCQSDQCFARAKWIEMVRSNFQASLAALQINIVDIVRGNTEQSPSGPYVKIPDSFRGICKFRTVGWRNFIA